MKARQIKYLRRVAILRVALIWPDYARQVNKTPLMRLPFDELKNMSERWGVRYPSGLCLVTKKAERWWGEDCTMTIGEAYPALITFAYLCFGRPYLGNGTYWWQVGKKRPRRNTLRLTIAWYKLKARLLC